MANDNNSGSSFWSIVGLILFLVYAFISSQTPSSREQYEHDYGVGDFYDEGKMTAE